MSHGLTRAILLLYPRRVRERHGPEIETLIDELITHEGRSRTGLCVRLALDGLAQRLVCTATAWTVAGVLAATSFGGLAVSDFATASAFQGTPHGARTVAPTRHTRLTFCQWPRGRPRRCTPLMTGVGGETAGTGIRRR